MFDSATMTSLRESLTFALQSPSGLDDPGRIDAIRALEELVCTATAAQAALAVELDASQRAAQADAGVPAAQQGRGIAAQVALARRESHHRGQRHLGLAKVVATELPHTWSAWRGGRITEWKATLITRETACLSREDRAAVDAAVAGDADRLERMGERELVAECQREAYRLDPASFVTRRRQAEADRHVTLRPAPDTMTWLSALLPVKDGVGVFAALTRAADTARRHRRPEDQGAGDGRHPRRLGRWRAAAGGQRLQTAGISLSLVMTDHALFGTSDEPAHLDGFGPIPADLAREIVAGACSRDEAVWLRRLYADPATGELVAMDARGRYFLGGLGRFIRLRDRICRTRGATPRSGTATTPSTTTTGGETSGDNGQGLCEACNHAKQAPGWRARPSPTAGHHQIQTTTPTGHTYRSTAPPVVATIHENSIRLDLYLAS